MLKNKTLHIGYVGRLEKEKGIEILRDCILFAISQEYDIHWHICGEGAYYAKLLSIDHHTVHLYGHVSKDMMPSILENIDLILMPSLFLETFGLVALEALSLGKPVSGFRRGGLIDFIHPSLELDPSDPVTSFFEILQQDSFVLVDTKQFSYDVWIRNLSEITAGSNKILLVNDYTNQIGGAETYVFELKKTLESLGKIVEMYGYIGKPNRWMRLFLMMVAPFAFWRKKQVQNMIRTFEPDLIWMHSISRYIGPFGLTAIYDSGISLYITHHDLGLISVRPSQIYAESDIPSSPGLADWTPKTLNIFSILTTLSKWIYIKWIWSFLSRDTIFHLIPSDWMISHFRKYTTGKISVYHHTIFPVHHD